MKKLLQWFAPIPFVVIAFGWGHSTGGASATPEDTTTYFYGSGIEDNSKVELGEQNNRYNLIGVDVAIVSNEIRYSLSESLGYVVEDGNNPLPKSAYADANWQIETDSDADGAIKGSVLPDAYTTDSTGLNIEDDKYYINIGESQQYVFDAVEYDFHEFKDELYNDKHELVDYVAKSSLNTAVTGSIWTAEMAIIEEYLATNYGTCAALTTNNVDGAYINGAASVKAPTAPDATGSALDEAGLFIAAGLTVAVAECK